MDSITKTKSTANAQKVSEFIAKAVFMLCAVLAIFAVASMTAYMFAKGTPI